MRVHLTEIYDRDCPHLRNTLMLITRLIKAAVRSRYICMRFSAQPEAAALYIARNGDDVRLRHAYMFL